MPRALTVAAATVANGGDNLATYIPLFATSTEGARAVIVAVLTVTAALWCVAAHLLIRNRLLQVMVRCWGARLLPVVLISLGAYILWQGGRPSTG